MAATEQAKADTAAQIKHIEERWTKALTKAGWTALPNIILEKQSVLKLQPLDVNIVLQIAKHWWRADSAPFPSIDTIAESIGVTARTVQRRITAMVERGLMERVNRYYARGGQKSNAYTFNGLIAQCTPFAEEATQQRAKRKATERARVRRKMPLTVVK